MPLPLVLIGLGAGSAVLGVGKGIKAAIDQKDAKETQEKAQELVDRSTTMINSSRKHCGDALNRLGEQKIDTLESSIKQFIAAFEKLHNVDFANSAGLDELQNFVIDKQDLDELKAMQSTAASLLGGVASGAAIGAITAFGAYSAAMAFGAASTGTAIATLSGVAATNATLAFLGGGSLAVGGLGMAGGAAVLGGLVAGPALAVMGFIVGGKASANKDRAHSNLAEAEKYKEEMQTAIVACNGIRRRADMFTRLLLRLGSYFDPLICQLQQIIETSGTDYSTFSPEQKKTVAAAMATAGAIKAVLDTPILNEDGELTKESGQIPGSITAFLESHEEA